MDDDPEEDCSCAIVVGSVCSIDEDRFDAVGVAVVGSAGVGEDDDGAHCHYSQGTI